MTYLETDRLILLPCVLEPFEEYVAMCADPDVMRYLLSDGQALTRGAAWQGFSAQVEHWHRRGFGPFSVLERTTGAFVGRVGPWQPEGWPECEMGWALRLPYWGRGYATEAARACVAYAFTDLNRRQIISLIAPENARSIRVAERLGERFERTLCYPKGIRTLQFALSKEAWARTQSR